MRFTKILLSICSALQLAEAQINSIAPFASIGDYKGQYVVMLFVPDLKKACVHDLLSYSAAADDFSSINTQVLIVSSDGAATEEDIKIPIIGNSNVAKEYGMEGASGIFIVDQEHRIRNAQISNCDAKRSVHETFRQVMAFKFSDKKKVAIPSTWDDIRSPNITKNDVKKLDFYSALPQKNIPIESTGVNEYKAEEVWMGPAAYGDMVLENNNEKEFYVSYYRKCFRYNGTVYKDDWSFKQVINTGLIGWEMEKGLQNRCFAKAVYEMQVGKTIMYTCPPELLNKAELDLFQLHGQMSYCELKVEEKTKDYIAEKEPPAGEWSGHFLLARLIAGGRQGLPGEGKAGPGDVVEAHVQVTAPNDWKQVLHSTFGGGETELFSLGQATPDCLNRAFELVADLAAFTVYCPAAMINNGQGWRQLNIQPGQDVRMIVQHME